MKLRIVLVLFMLAVGIQLFAQSVPKDEDRFFYGSEVDKDFAVVRPNYSFSNKGIQYGAILSPIFMYEDNNYGSLSSYILNAKVWAKVYLWSNSFLYVSGRNSYTGFISTDGAYEDLEADNVLDLDQAFLAMAYLNNSLNFSLGRKYYMMGTGLVLNGRGDGAEFLWHSSYFDLNLLGLYTGLLLKDNNPYGLKNMADISDGAKRMFSGGTLSFNFYNQKLYMFGLVQMDFSDQTTGEETKYDSQYYGIGLDGVLFSNLAYYAEFVYEMGTSYNSKELDSTGKPIDPHEKADIAAFAINSGINYYIPVALSPVLILQYSFGSGDEYRTDYNYSNRTENINGDPTDNDARGKDKGFIAFGTFAGGYALRPAIGNMHIIRAGFSFAPFRPISLGAKYLYYLKDKKDAPINSGEADMPEAFIGQGVDVSLRWQLYSDLSMYVNYGLFMPGDAYDSSFGNCNFVMAGINLSI